MARLVIPEDFLQQVELLKSVKNKHDSFAVGSSVLTAFLAQHAINLDDDVVAGNAACVHDNVRSKKSKKAENCTQKRDLHFNTVMANMRNYYQFLKVFYSPNFMQTGEWGAPITVSGRINYPPGFAQWAFIFQLLKTKYDSYPAGSSPLEPYLVLHGLSIAADEAATLAATTLNNDAQKFAAAAEYATGERNNLWLPVLAHLRIIGAFLMKLYNNNPKEAGEWGYTVDDSPLAHKMVVSKVKLNSVRTVVNCIIGGTLKNIGPVALLVYKGRAATGNCVTLLPDEVYPIARGFSVITVVNQSTTTAGVFSALRSA